MGWTNASVHNKYNLSEDNSNKGVLVHQAPSFYIKGTIERTSASSITYNITTLKCYDSSAVFGYRLAVRLKIGSSNIDLVTIAAGALTGGGTVNINKSGSVSVSGDEVSVAIQIKCEASSYEGCTIQKDGGLHSGTAFENLPYGTITSFDMKFVAPGPSGLDFTAINITTKSFVIVPTWSGSGTCTIKVGGTTKTTTTSGGNVKFDNMKHGTQHLVNVSVSNGSSTATTPDKYVETSKISVSVEYKAVKNTIEGSATFNTYDGTVTNSEAVAIPIGGTTGDGYVLYVPNTDKKRFVLANLKYFTEYTVKYSVTDGYNVVTNTQTIKTEAPCILIYHIDTWVTAMPYVYTLGEWKPAIPMVYNNNEWKNTNA